MYYIIIFMKELIISKEDSGQRLDRFISKTFPKLPKSLMFKEIRKKNIKINKKRTAPDYFVNEDDVLQLYLNDDVLEEKQEHYDFMRASKELNIIYEDENLLLIDKKAGVLCHPVKDEYTDTVISRVQRYLYKKNEWNPKDSKTFSPALANRLDRNTAGIIIAAKNAEALRVLNSKIKSREIEKYYLAATEGTFNKKSDTLTAYLVKNEKQNKVYVYDEPHGDCKKIITKYSVLESRNNKSLVEIELITGRTHQIRAHFAHIGHPLINDGKYGKNEGRYRQELYSYKLKFNFKDENLLSYLNGRTFTVNKCELISRFKENNNG